MVADAGVMRMRGSERATRDGVVEVTLSLSRVLAVEVPQARRHIA